MAAARHFLRARAPAEKEIRRQAILQAARRLTSEVGSVAFSLSELARRSGVSKPNIYRYFESREEVLLQVWVAEVRALSDILKKRFLKTPRGDVKTTARIVAASFTALPRLGELMSIVAPVLEQNLSIKAIVTAKLTLAELSRDIAIALRTQLPALSLADCAWASRAIATFVAGIWPSSHPGPTVSRALERPELAGMATSFQPDFTRFLEVLFAGLLVRNER